jgi:hypothetical protein
MFDCSMLLYISLRSGPNINTLCTMVDRGPGSVVGIATAYRLDGPGIESRWGRDFPHLPDRP